MPPANATITGGTLVSDDDAGRRLAAAGKPSINAAVPMSKANINGRSNTTRCDVVGLSWKKDLSWDSATSTDTPLRNPTRTGCGVNLMIFATPASPKIVCHRPASTTQRNIATTIRSRSLATAGIASSAVVRLASSSASLTRDVVTTNDDVANSADTQQETMAPHSPAAAPATA